MVAIRVFQQLLGLVRPIILARLLAPDDFGLIGIAIMTRLVVERLGIAGGFRDALIRRDDLTKEHYESAWTLEVLRAIAFGGIVALLAPYIAEFFRAPEATPIIRIAGLEIAILALVSVGMIFVRKELKFKKEFYFRIIPSIIGTGVTIWLAFELRNVWALALGQLTISILSVLMSYLVAPYFMRPRIDLPKVKEIAGFAIWTSVTNLFFVAASHVDRFFVGRILGPTSLGIYVISGRITNLVSHELSHGVLRVGFPTFAKLQVNRKVFNEAFGQLVASTIFILSPLAFVIAVWAPELVEVVLGSKWLDAVPVIRVLAGAAVLHALAQIYRTALLSLGRASVTATAAAVHLTIVAATAYPLITNFGVAGTGWAVISGNGATVLFLFFRGRGALQLSALNLGRSVVIAALLSSGLLLAPVLRDIDSLEQYQLLLAGLSIFGAVYLAAAFVLYKFTHYGPLQILVDFRTRRSRESKPTAVTTENEEST